MKDKAPWRWSKSTKKKLWNNICNLWYGFHRTTVKKLYDGMPSMVEAVCKGKLDLLVLFC